MNHLYYGDTLDAPRRRASFRAVLLLGVVVIGRFFPQPTDNLRAWRLAAWIVSGGVYAAHIWYEHFRLRSSPRMTALRVAEAVAIGGFALAVAGMIRSLSATSAIRPAWLLALVIWPAVTAVPAFLGALVSAAILRRYDSKAPAVP